MTRVREPHVWLSISMTLQQLTAVQVRMPRAPVLWLLSSLLLCIDSFPSQNIKREFSHQEEKSFHESRSCFHVVDPVAPGPFSLSRRPFSEIQPAKASPVLSQQCDVWVAPDLKPLTAAEAGVPAFSEWVTF